MASGSRMWRASHSARPNRIPPGRIPKIGLTHLERRRTGRQSLKQRHLVQKLNDDQMGSTLAGETGLVVSTKQDANRGVDGRVRVSDRD